MFFISFICLYVIVFCSCFFFFKQKTAYEMRISDWSSDVCSSDLTPSTRRRLPAQGRGRPLCEGDRDRCHVSRSAPFQAPHALSGSGTTIRARGGLPASLPLTRPASAILRSEEHTSELQSLMRISYAVFCLKKKKKHKSNPQHTTKKLTNKQT